jgi:hypothetical protein
MTLKSLFDRLKVWWGRLDETIKVGEKVGRLVPWLRWLVPLLVTIGTLVSAWLKEIPGPFWVPLALFTFLGLAWTWNLISSWLRPSTGAKGVAGADPGQFQRYVKVFRAEVDTRHVTTGGFLLFTFWVFNGWSSPVCVKRAGGHVRFNDREFPGNAELYEDPGDAPYGATVRLVIRQFISPDERKGVEAPDPGLRADFRFDAVCVYVAPVGVQDVEKRLDLPELCNRPANWRIRWND